MNLLEQYAVRHGTDKAQARVGRLTPKGYTAVYGRLLEALEVQALLELGVARGASIRMWADYLPRAEVVGVDVRPPKISHPRVRLYRGRQEDKKLLREIAAVHGPFQVVIDDGSHQREDQIASFETLWPHVAPGGFYAIEDLHAPNAIGMAAISELCKRHGPLEVLVESKGRLVVFEKRQTTRDAPPRPE